MNLMKNSLSYFHVPSKANGSKRAVSLRSGSIVSRGFPSLELDTVVEEKSDPEQTQVWHNERISLNYLKLEKLYISCVFFPDRFINDTRVAW